MYIIAGLGWCSTLRSALFHLVCKQEELQHRVKVLHDGLFHSFLQQVPLCLDLCIFIPFQCLHGGLQEPQAHQHRALGRRRWSKGVLDVEQLPSQSIMKNSHGLPKRSGYSWIMLKLCTLDTQSIFTFILVRILILNCKNAFTNFE